MLRMLKILLIVSVASWGLLGVFNNILDWDGTTGAVGATTSMEPSKAAQTTGVPRPIRPLSLPEPYSLCFSNQPARFCV